MRGWGKIREWVRTLNRFVARMGGVFLIALMLITAIDVVGRDVFNRPIAGTVELSQYMLAVFVLLGFAYAHQAKAHVAVSIFTSHLNEHARLILNILATLLCLFVSCILVWQGWVVGMEERAVSDMLRVPQYPFRLLVALAAFLMCLELLIDLGDALKRLAGRSS